MKNVIVSYDQDANTLRLEIDTSVRLGATKSGKAIHVGTSEGWVEIDPNTEVSFNLNVVERVKKRRVW